MKRKRNGRGTHSRLSMEQWYAVRKIWLCMSLVWWSEANVLEIPGCKPPAQGVVWHGNGIWVVRDFWGGLIADPPGGAEGAAGTQLPLCFGVPSPSLVLSRWLRPLLLLIFTPNLRCCCEHESGTFQESRQATTESDRLLGSEASPCQANSAGILGKGEGSEASMSSCRRQRPWSSRTGNLHHASKSRAWPSQRWTQAQKRQHHATVT